MSVHAKFRRFLPLVTALTVLGPAASHGQDAPADTTGGVIDTREAWARVAAARDAAQQERHHEAAAEYLEALAHDARLVETVAKEIAYQKLWREDADKAIFYFHRYLARHPGQENREARKGLALAYSWSGRQPQAVALYRRLAGENPADGGSRVGLGRSLIWNNQLQEGYAVLRGVEQEFPTGSSPRTACGNFLLTYLDGYTTPWEVRVDASWDSDDLDITRFTAAGAFTVLDNKLLQVSPSVAFFRLPGQADITAPRLKAGLVGALRHNLNLHAYAWVDHFGSGAPLYGGTDELSWTRPGGDFWFTWLPAPRWRIDAGANSMAVETFYALNRHLHYEQANLSADWRFARSLSAGLAGNLAGYSDGNAKRRVAANLRWKREGKWQVQAGPNLVYMDFSHPYPGGYWAPDWVRSASFGVNLKTRSGRVAWLLDGSLGVEKETGADAVTVGGISGRVGWRLQPGWLVAAEAGYSKSSLAADSGYNRLFAGLSLRGHF